MSIFSNPFFSLAGQKERLTNVANVLSIAANPFSSGKVTANVQNSTVKAATEFIANNPYTTAAIVATGGSGAGRTAVSTAISGLSTSTKVAAAVISIPAASALASSERSRTAVINTASDLTPEKLAKFGNRVGTAIENPNLSTLKDAAFENKTLLIAAGAATVAAGGTAALGALGTYQNTQAVKANTRVAEATIVNVPKQDAPNIVVNVPPTPLSPSSSAPTTPISASPAAVASPVAAAPAPKKKKKAKKKAKKTKKNIKKKPKKKKNVRPKPRKKAKKKVKKPSKKKKTAKNSRKKT